MITFVLFLVKCLLSDFDMQKYKHGLVLISFLFWLTIVRLIFIAFIEHPHFVGSLARFSFFWTVEAAHF